MRSRAKARGRRYTSGDDPLAQDMLARGDRSQDVAAYFGVNSGRFEKGEGAADYGDLTPEQRRKLPPPGPYELDKQYVELYRLIVEVDILWEAGKLGGAKGLLESIVRYGVHTDELYSDMERSADQILRDERGFVVT